jgi:hypothetical protein
MKRDLGSMLAGAAVPGDGAHNFVQSQLNSGEPQLPQYDPSAGWHKGKELGLFAAGFAPGAGIAAASGNMPNADGGFEPSAADDWRAGNYFSAAMKGLGAAGDAAYAVPGIGSAAGAALHTPLAMKMAMAAVPMAKRSTALTDISKLPVDDAIKVARKEPHLIKAGDQSEGFYVGGPRDINSKRGLTNRRQGFDAYVAADPRGSDWYDRYRNAVTEVTGGDQQQMDWMTKTHGMMSAGVDPGSETQFALRETSGQVAGMPVKAARPAQHEALQAAIDNKDPSHIMLGDKTGEYARLIHPDQSHQGATGVNDFRHARNWGYTEASGDAQRDALTDAQHRFMDYETALAVDRANKAGVGGRNDWTGEQLQAAPWVRQKAEAIAETRKMPYEEAFGHANNTIADFFPKHTAYATHESMPGPSTGHLPDLPHADQATRDAYSSDPRSLWNNAPGGRDAIYSGLGVEGTGVNMRVQPSIDMTGSYVPAGMERQFNQGQTARPLVAFQTKDAGGANLAVKQVATADKALLNAGELTRAYIDAQDAGAWHKPFTDGKASAMQSYFTPMDRKATVGEIDELQRVASMHGLPDVIDSGQGLTATNFGGSYGPQPGPYTNRGRKAVEKALPQATPAEAGAPQRAAIDSRYAGLEDEWAQGVGSGAATDKLLAALNQNPQMRAAFNNNPYIGQNAAARMDRDAGLASQFGGVRPDIQNARQAISGPAGWVDRLEAARRSGVALPAIGAGLLAPSLLQGRTSPQGPEEM